MCAVDVNVIPLARCDDDDDCAYWIPQMPPVHHYCFEFSFASHSRLSFPFVLLRRLVEVFVCGGSCYKWMVMIMVIIIERSLIVVFVFNCVWWLVKCLVTVPAVALNCYIASFNKFSEITINIFISCFKNVDVVA